MMPSEKHSYENVSLHSCIHFVLYFFISVDILHPSWDTPIAGTIGETNVNDGVHVLKKVGVCCSSQTIPCILFFVSFMPLIQLLLCCLLPNHQFILFSTPNNWDYNKIIFFKYCLSSKGSEKDWKGNEEIYLFQPLTSSYRPSVGYT